MVSITQSINLSFDMVDYFLDGTGTPYSNILLTFAVAASFTTSSYVSDFIKQLKIELKENGGDINAIAKDNTSLRGKLQGADVYLSEYSYNNPFTGLSFMVHGWTESIVEVTDYSFSEYNNTYSGTLKFTFIDDFVLDDGDLSLMNTSYRVFNLGHGFYYAEPGFLCFPILGC